MTQAPTPPPAAPPPAPAQPPARPAVDNILLGVLWMVVAVSLFPFQNAAVKWLAQEYPINQIVWARFAGHLLVVSLLFLPLRGRRLFHTRRPDLQLARSFTLLASTTFFATSVIYLPLATASAIGFTAPFIVTALSVPMLGEKVGPRRWAAVLVGFAGAVIIIRPGGDAFHWAMLLTLGAALFYSIYQILTRRLATVDDAVTTIAHTAIVGTVVATCVLPFSYRMPDSLLDVGLFLLVGAIGGLSHFLVVQALRYGPASVLSPLGYFELLVTVIVGYLVFDNLPDALTWAGAAVIIASGIYIAYRESVVRRQGRR